MILRRLPDARRAPDSSGSAPYAFYASEDAAAQTTEFDSTASGVAQGRDVDYDNRLLPDGAPELPPISADEVEEPPPSRWRRLVGAYRLSLQFRLAMFTSVAVILSAIASCVASYAVVSQVLYEEVNKSLQTQAQNMIDSGWSFDEKHRTADGKYQPRFENLTNTMKTLIVPAANAGRAADATDFSALLADGSLSAEEMSVIKGQEPFIFSGAGNERSFAIAAPDGRVVIVAQDIGFTQRALDTLTLVLVLISILVVVGAIIVGVAAASAGVYPISRLRKATNRVSRTGELRQIPVVTQDELGLLTSDFNNMMRALEASRRKQKELVADASHELKTPLTSMRTNIELLLMASRPGQQKISPQDRADLERDVMAQMDELSSLIGDLVALAREDEPRHVTEVVELTGIIRNAQERAHRRRPDVTFELHLTPWELKGDSASLGRAMVNLLDNAAKWSPDNGTVRVWMQTIFPEDAATPSRGKNTHRSSAPQGEDSNAAPPNRRRGAIEIRVADSGPGIPESERSKVFDRFYRSINSRSMPGSGLGLAIVKEVVDSHHGAIIADESDDGGALIRMVLPGWLPVGDEDAEDSRG